MFGKMKLENLEKLYRGELKDAYDFEHQILDALPKMVDNANDPNLRSAFQSHLDETRRQVEMLEQVFRSLDEKPDRKTCAGMKGIISEGESFLEAKGDADTLDASLIAAAQRVEHYEIATYGTLRTYARVLGHADQERIFGQILDQESRADEKLTQLAEAGINEAAAVHA